MKKLLILGAVAATMFAAFAQPASAQVVPNVRGLEAFTAETNYMSLAGYLRWQYYQENTAWISRAEAVALVRDQVGTATAIAPAE